MKHPREIIISPLITEKTSLQRETTNSYSFKVSINANKIEIKSAIEKIFEVSVVRVNTIRQLGKVKRMGKYVGKRADWKKAIVTLKPGNKIPDFEV